MTNAHRADRALATLRALPIPNEEATTANERRRRVVAHIQALRLVEERRATSIRRRWVLGMVAAACLFVLGGFGLAFYTVAPHMGGPAAVLVATKGKVQVAAPELGSSDTASVLPPGSEVATGGDSSASLTTPSGVELLLEERSRLEMAGERRASAMKRTESIHLLEGEVLVMVPRLGSHRQFEVVTPDAVVVVHGTQFSVRVERGPRGEPTTRVDVASGKVEVRRKAHTDWLGPGSRWSSEEVLPSTAASETPSTDLLNPMASGTPASEEEPMPTGPGNGPARGAGTESRLGAANRLMEEAMLAKRRGDEVQTIAHLDELLEKYADSPLVPSARRERARAVARLVSSRDSATKPSKDRSGDAASMSGRLEGNE